MDDDFTDVITFKAVEGSTFIYENLSFLNISLKEIIGIREIDSREGDFVSVSSYLIAPVHDQRYIQMVFPSHMLQEEDLLSCQTYIRDQLTAQSGYSPPISTFAPLTARLAEIAHRLNIDYDQVRHNNDMPGGYVFDVDMEIIIYHDIEIVDVINIEDDDEDGLLDGQVTSRRTTSKTAFQKLKAASGIRFINGDNEKKELGRCCICLEEMCVGKQLQLVGLPCEHVFHENCLLRWFYNTDSCPLCRRTPLEDY